MGVGESEPGGGRSGEDRRKGQAGRVANADAARVLCCSEDAARCAGVERGTRMPAAAVEQHYQRHSTEIACQR